MTTPAARAREIVETWMLADDEDNACLMSRIEREITRAAADAYERAAKCCDVVAMGRETVAAAKNKLDVDGTPDLMAARGYRDIAAAIRALATEEPRRD